MKTNKKGLSDIVTTALIILLVAVATAAIWAFVKPQLQGTGKQFTQTSVCISNSIDPVTCKVGADTAYIAGAGATDVAKPRWNKVVQIRRTLSDGVSVPTEIVVLVEGKTPGGKPTYATNNYYYATNYANSGKSLAAKDTVNFLNMQQGELIAVYPANFTGDTATGDAAILQPAAQSSQVKVVTTYRQPDNTIVTCPSLPITCD